MNRLNNWVQTALAPSGRILLPTNRIPSAAYAAGLLRTGGHWRVSPLFICPPFFLFHQPPSSRTSVTALGRAKINSWISFGKSRLNLTAHAGIVIAHNLMFSRWLRWLVVAPVVLFVFGAIMLSCSGSGGGGTSTATPGPGFSLESMTIADGAPPSPTFSATSTSRKTPKPTVTPTLTPRAASTSTTLSSSGPNAVPTGGTVAFNVIGTFTKKSKTQYQDITAGPETFWTSPDNSILQGPPAPGAQGGIY